MAEKIGNYRHGMYGTPTYKSWSEMKHRCKNPRQPCYVGITYCEEWENFDNFLRDMGERPKGTTLDRIDPRGNYEPSNCRWADILTQENNRRNNKRFSYNGEELTLPQIARKYGISRSNLANKVYLKQISIEEAVDFLRRKRGSDLSQSAECSR